MENAGIITRSWWAYLLRGILAIAIGIILLSWPGATVGVLIVVFGIFALIEGAIEFVMAIIMASKLEPWGMAMIKSLVGLLIGGVMVSRPGVALAVVIILIGIWMIITGFIQLLIAFELPPMTGRSLVGVGGVLSIIIGILLIAIPFDTVGAVLILVSTLLLIWGVWLMFLGIYALITRRKVEAA
ncbi:MAG: DUF308 domain-containing protein [Actinobacteria bacterium]|nr:DUF308 domain-containing protein [Actinomycetota bacterium]